jgi:hypothetical protein
MKAKVFAQLTAIIALTIAGVAASPLACAGATNVIWQADTSGSLAIQVFTPQVEPRQKTATYNNKAFLRMILGENPKSTYKLAMNVDMQNTRTNIYLSIFDTETLENAYRLTTFENTTLISDGENLTFTVSATMPAIGNDWGGGFIRMAGRGKMINGVPGSLKSSIQGWFIDINPTDIGGTTGVVLRAKINTTARVLRAQPSAP